MQQPEGFVVPGLEHKVCKIVKSLYGLKQSGRRWYVRFAQVVQQQGLKRCRADACVFVYRKGAECCILVVYVDDIAAIASNQRMRKLARDVLAKDFEIRPLGPINYMLGIKFVKSESNGLLLNQTHYIEKVLKRFGMQDCTPVVTPVVTASQAVSGNNFRVEEEVPEKIPLRELVGSLSYIANGTRPDISFAVNSLAQHAASPTREDWQAGKRVLRYLQGTKHYSLRVNPNEEGFKIYADASHGSDPSSRKSTTGIVATFGGVPFFWASNKQKTVSLSTMESEYKALSQAVQETLWTRELFGEIGFDSHCKEPMLYVTDSQSAKAHASSYIENFRTKHMEIIYHHVREKIENKEILVEYVPTKFNLADALTKAQPGPRQVFLNNCLSLVSSSR